MGPQNAAEFFYTSDDKWYGAKSPDNDINDLKALATNPGKGNIFMFLWQQIRILNWCERHARKPKNDIDYVEMLVIKNGCQDPDLLDHAWPWPNHLRNEKDVEKLTSIVARWARNTAGVLVSELAAGTYEPLSLKYRDPEHIWKSSWSDASGDDHVSTSGPNASAAPSDPQPAQPTKGPSELLSIASPAPQSRPPPVPPHHTRPDPASTQLPPSAQGQQPAPPSGLPYPTSQTAQQPAPPSVLPYDEQPSASNSTSAQQPYAPAARPKAEATDLPFQGTARQYHSSLSIPAASSSRYPPASGGRLTPELGAMPEYGAQASSYRTEQQQHHHHHHHHVPGAGPDGYPAFGLEEGQQQLRQGAAKRPEMTGREAWFRANTAITNWDNNDPYQWERDSTEEEQQQTRPLRGAQSQHINIPQPGHVPHPMMHRQPSQLMPPSASSTYSSHPVQQSQGQAQYAPQHQGTSLRSHRQAPTAHQQAHAQRQIQLTFDDVADYFLDMDLNKQ
ncbi:hypothetical protein AC579_1135 [Pseudocercospora musae]|uniref:Uncharacterized protein n=1 Tax=Pseudocercospora musae TaxID=113226 RepID=A0A139GTK4_9PEZI|nr:hypothetical protein AC579_1135 [Pseudocercospora musae]